MKNAHTIAIIGGGAAGFFSAIIAAEKAKESNKSVSIHIFESSNQYLKKVRISGGGRCNVTHNCFEPRDFVKNYPRGSKELLSPMQRFQAQDTIQWFKKSGVQIVAEEDGRMFPDTNSSQTIIDCYLKKVEELGIKLHPKTSIKSIQLNEDKHFVLTSQSQSLFVAHKILIATGSSEGGYKLSESLGHSISERAPSLFSFKIKDSLLSELQGLSFDKTKLKLSLPHKKIFKQEGPSLITHWGLSGPAILKLSAWAAREMKNANYQAKLTVNWLGSMTRAEVEQALLTKKKTTPKSFLKNAYPEDLPHRFWLKVLEKSQVSLEKQWANISKKELSSVLNTLTESVLVIAGQNRFKEEFVECGGISLKEVSFKTMESKIIPGLHFAGEILDVDGITGGFNFQNAWTTGWVAAHNMIQV